ncbi:DNA-directed RNA polymerase III subunit RPC4 [Mastacembelus armatus]|uniref:Polymerase (RNA) III (DNA directed) polypeptide D n=1 Tax=Mastacembelus armatus TaxID=205130 RepID=A0A3Q3LGA8_9TELE|nr:DNA-directed RNA polymerase III subunit RPC4 [Mastacembelus armatus]XP_026178259.1 DNA-directed RNA polymerase III subunit RPC4 [Mastacembelus armatus]XP_026178260.1 DNA-directed RNA polymerase III subunit RPC4 [Mastacembelus armatus]XP_026178261.1 DNA-directed RNA polymerase III subunit RPC4 [Mastacembelus armatus]
MSDSGSGNSSGQRVPTPGGTGAGLLMGRRPSAAISPGRLPSMRPRDLTLGGVKKKTFTPNIIGRKVKDETKVEGGQRRERKDADRGRGSRERGRGRGRAEMIQSHSIFEQGPAEMMMKKKSSFESERDAPIMGPSPIINIKKEKRETEEETKEILRSLERDNFIDDPFLRSEQRSCPVQLPLAVSGWGFKEEFSKADVKIEKLEEDCEPMESAVKVKEEPEEMEIQKSETMFKPPPLPEPEVLPKLLHDWSLSKGEELFFMQLPDSLPGQPPTKEHKPVKTEVQSEDGQSVLLKTESQEEEVEDNSCNVKDLREGLIGKMLVRKSGRVQLILGQVTLDVSLGTTCSFLQELVSIGTEGKTGELTVLGKVKHKMVCSPDFEALLLQSA